MLKQSVFLFSVYTVADLSVAVGTGLAESEGVMTPEGPMITTCYTHAQLASMIGANREAVTRAIAQLQEGGCVEVKRRRVYVKDFDALRRDAGE